MINVDTTLNNEGFLMGIGSIVRNSFDQVIAAISKPMKGRFSVKEIEAKAISYCLHWLKDINCVIYFIEIDALNVSQSVHNPPHHYGRFHDLIHDIIYQISSFTGISLSYVCRSANSVAHGLARYALRMDTDIVWRTVCLALIEAIVVDERVH
uniref:RNase H type-1 domain-containing protein n=1 Tax=Cannabis sativa TaxID=3483 RepID=A0A803PW88_CANSA